MENIVPLILVTLLTNMVARSLKRNFLIKGVGTILLIVIFRDLVTNFPNAIAYCIGVVSALLNPQWFRSHIVRPHPSKRHNTISIIDNLKYFSRYKVNKKKLNITPHHYTVDEGFVNFPYFSKFSVRSTLCQLGGRARMEWYHYCPVWLLVIMPVILDGLLIPYLNETPPLPFITALINWSFWSIPLSFIIIYLISYFYLSAVCHVLVTRHDIETWYQELLDFLTNKEIESHKKWIEETQNRLQKEQEVRYRHDIKLKKSKEKEIKIIDEHTRKYKVQQRSIQSLVDLSENIIKGVKNSA